MNKQAMITVVVTAIIVLMIAPRLRALPIVSKIPTV